MASAVTIRPSRSSISRSTAIAVISFDLSATFTWPSTRRASAANACTRCTGERADESAKERLSDLPSMAMTSPSSTSAQSSRSRNSTLCKLPGSSALNRSENASWLGMPCFNAMKRRKNPSFARPYRSMSAQPSPPHSVESNPIINISCSEWRVALLRRGSATPSNSAENSSISDLQTPQPMPGSLNPQTQSVTKSSKAIPLLSSVRNPG